MQNQKDKAGGQDSEVSMVTEIQSYYGQKVGIDAAETKQAVALFWCIGDPMVGDWEAQRKLHMLKDLLEKGADPNMIYPYGEGQTPLCKAAMVGNVAAINTLLEYGADITQKAGENGRGLSAFEYAVRYQSDHSKLLETLISAEDQDEIPEKEQSCRLGPARSSRVGPFLEALIAAGGVSMAKCGEDKNHWYPLFPEITHDSETYEDRWDGITPRTKQSIINKEEVEEKKHHAERCDKLSFYTALEARPDKIDWSKYTEEFKRAKYSPHLPLTLTLTLALTLTPPLTLILTLTLTLTRPIRSPPPSLMPERPMHPPRLTRRRRFGWPAR